MKRRKKDGVYACTSMTMLVLSDVFVCLCGSVVVYIYCILYLEVLLLIYIVYYISKENLSGNRCSLRAVYSTLTETILDRLQKAINGRIYIDNL